MHKRINSPRHVCVHHVKHLAHCDLLCDPHQVVVVGKGVLHVCGGADLVGGRGGPLIRESGRYRQREVDIDIQYTCSMDNDHVLGLNQRRCDLNIDWLIFL